MLGTPEADVPTILPEKLNQWYKHSMNTLFSVDLFAAETTNEPARTSQIRKINTPKRIDRIKVING